MKVSWPCLEWPLSLKVKPWSYVFTSICAIIGGAYSVATLVDLALSSAINCL